ncbi:MAG: YitT family protein, partial [Firmicutes bacterium]|nr:YitT family protein [Bacillota bacterium]
MMENRFYGFLKNAIVPFFGVLLGSLIMAVGMNLFLVPHRLAAGGISGLGVIFFHLFDIPAGLTIAVLNIPIFIAAWFILGRDVVLRSIMGTFLFPLAIEVTAPFLPAATQDPLLAALYGGVIMGLGLGLVFHYRGSTGGTALLSLILNRTTGLTMGQGLLGGDLAVIGLAVFVLGGEAAMYAVISLFVSVKIIDLLQEGFSLAKVVLII